MRTKCNYTVTYGLHVFMIEEEEEEESAAKPRTRPPTCYVEPQSLVQSRRALAQSRRAPSQSRKASRPWFYKGETLRQLPYFLGYNEHVRLQYLDQDFLILEVTKQFLDISGKLRVGIWR